MDIADENTNKADAKDIKKIVKLLEKHNTPIVVLENVKNLINIDKGNTFQVILQTLVGELEISPGKRLNYYVDFKVLNALDFGCPQNRERIFIICFNKNIFKLEKIIELYKWLCAIIKAKISYLI